MVAQSLQLSMGTNSSQTALLDDGIDTLCVLLEDVVFWRKPSAKSAHSSPCFLIQLVVGRKSVELRVMKWTFGSVVEVFCPRATIGYQQGRGVSHLAFCDRLRHVAVQRKHRNGVLMTRVAIK